MLPGPVVAVDIDLHRIHVVAQEAPAAVPELVVVDQPDLWSVARTLNMLIDYDPKTTVLIEVASQHTYTPKKQIGRQAWTIWNTYAATALAAAVRTGARMLCAPSSVWTKGYEESTRHALAGVTRLGRTKDQNHNLNECQAMIWFYRHDPTAWLPVHEYFSRLSAARGKPRRGKSGSPPSSSRPTDPA